MITIGAVISTSGNNMGQALTGSRSLFALAEQKDIPAFFGQVHAIYRTPAVAILFTSAVSLVLAVSGTFQVLAQTSAISRLVVYIATCAATLRLRQPRFAAAVHPASFVLRGGPVIPMAAIAVALVILVMAERRLQLAALYAMLGGAVLYVIAVRGKK
jgi:APA family basic amino acid/polyamine antiporter